MCVIYYFLYAQMFFLSLHGIERQKIEHFTHCVNSVLLIQNHQVKMLLLLSKQCMCIGTCTMCKYLFTTNMGDLWLLTLLTKAVFFVFLFFLKHAIHFAHRCPHDRALNALNIPWSKIPKCAYVFRINFCFTEAFNRQYRKISFC